MRRVHFKSEARGNGNGVETRDVGDLKNDTRAARARVMGSRAYRVTNSCVTARLPVIFKIWRSCPGFSEILGDQDPGRFRDLPEQMTESIENKPMSRDRAKTVPMFIYL